MVITDFFVPLILNQFNVFETTCEIFINTRTYFYVHIVNNVNHAKALSGAKSLPASVNATFDIMTCRFRRSLFLFFQLSKTFPRDRLAILKLAHAQAIDSLIRLPPPPDPTFVHAHLIPDSGEKNDDKLYFFFREKASEVGQSPMTQSRIGRICLVSLSRRRSASLPLIVAVERFIGSP